MSEEASVGESAYPDGSLEQAVSRLMAGSEESPTQESEEPDQPNAPTEALAEEEVELTETTEEVYEQEAHESDDAEEEVEYEEEQSEEGSVEGEEPQMYSLTIEGEEYEVSLDELTEGYLRQSDYTKKTQTVAEERKAIEAEVATLSQGAEEMTKVAQMAHDVLNRKLQAFSEVDWKGLKESDPAEFLSKQIEMQEVRNEQAELVQNYETSMNALREQHTKAQAEAMKAEEANIYSSFPDWRDAEKAKEGYGKITAYARQIGFDDNTLQSLYTARDLQVLDKARKWDELQQTKKTITKKKSPVIRKVTKTKGVAPKSAGSQKKLREVTNRARKSGSTQDAAARLLAMRSANAKSK